MKGHILKIQINGAKPPCWRRVFVPEHISFKSLAEIINIVFSWSDYEWHFFEFHNSPDTVVMETPPNRVLHNMEFMDADEEEYWENYDPDRAGKLFDRTESDGDMYDAGLDFGRALERAKIRYRESVTDIEDFLYTVTSIRYIYDLDDHWSHRIILEKDAEMPDPEQGSEEDEEYRVSGVKLIKYKGDQYTEGIGETVEQDEGERYEVDPEEIQEELDQVDLVYVAPKDRHGPTKPQTQKEYEERALREFERYELGDPMDLLPPELRAQLEANERAKRSGWSESRDSGRNGGDGNGGDDNGGATGGDSKIIPFPGRQS